MPRAFFFSLIPLFCIGLTHCVGDEPASGDGSDGSDASTTDSSPSDGGGGDGGNPSDSGSDGAVVTGDACIGHSDCPPSIEGANLQLWLRANAGLNCASGRVSVWNDQSGKGRNAGAPVRFDAGGAKGLTPRCGVDVLNGLPVPTFGDPAELDAGTGTQFVDETLEVDLDFINDTNYTVFVVERRTADHFQWLVGQDRSTLPGSPMLSCTVSDQEDAFGFGFEEPAGPALGYLQVCSGGAGPGSAFAPTANVDEVVFSSSVGHILYSNGASVYTGPGTGKDLEPVHAGGTTHRGTIGRAFSVFGSDSRFDGNIAEIIVYNAALTITERVSIEGYLKRQWGLLF